MVMIERSGPAAATESDKASELHATVLRSVVGRSLFGEAFHALTSLGPYDLQRSVGQGGMGVVFEAVDRRTRQRVALKVLRKTRVRSMQRLKREFRALSGLCHPNLVRLHELYLEDDPPFFSMELVEGQRLHEYVRADGELDLARLQAVMRQLVDVVSSLHAAGKLHRDLKPANLLVRSDGQLVLLDFGLARAIDDDLGGSFSGTPTYMAPERLSPNKRLGRANDEAAEWYGVGAILYEALSGRPPCSAQEITDEAGSWPEPLAAVGPLPLSQLCLRMLASEPEARPTGTELRAFFALPAEPTSSSVAGFQNQSGLFVGRTSELASLGRAFEKSREARCVIAYVHGEPGIGKTALVHEFVRQLQQREAVHVLVSRCYEREHVPYNAIDGLIDVLIDALRELPAVGTATLHEEDAVELIRLFPALRELSAFEAAATASSGTRGDPHRARERAFAALRGVLQALAAQRPLVVHLDDLQWGDADSTQLLLDVLAGPGIASLLLIVSYRSADAARSACLSALTRAYPVGSAAHEVALGPLDDTDALTLAQSLSEQDTAWSELTTSASEPQLRALSAEAAGSPLFLRALVQRRRVIGPVQSSLHELLKTWVDALSPAGRHLIELLALAGRPLSRTLLLQAAQASSAELDWVSELADLQQGGLLRMLPGRAEPNLDSYHDRLRETVSTTVEPAIRKRAHAQLAEAAAAFPEPDLEFIAYQYDGAGQPLLAARYAELAGDRASESLAIEHAAELYTLALRGAEPARPAALVAKLANAVGFAGRCAEAAPLYLEAATGHDQQTSLRLHLRAAEMYMRSGDLPRGAEVAKPVLREVGVRYPSSKAAAQLSAVVSLARLRYQNLHDVRSRRAPTDLERLRGDACFGLGHMLGIVDPMRGCALLLRSLRLALKAGTDAQLARSLGCYSWMRATLGNASITEQDRLLDEAWRIACRSGDVDAKGWVLHARAITCANRGDFQNSQHWAGQARRWIATHCADAGWLLGDLDTGPCANLLLMGHMRQLDHSTSLVSNTAQKQGNEHQLWCARAHRVFVWLAHDESTIARSIVDELVDQWSTQTFYQPMALAIFARLNSLLYQGQSDAAQETLDQYRPQFRNAGYLRAHPWAIVMPLLESTIALACACHNRDPRPLARAKSGIRQLKSQPYRWAQPCATLLEAGLARYHGRAPVAAELYRLAANGFDSVDMPRFAMSARIRCAELLGSEQGAALRASAEAWFEAEGIVNPERWVAMHAPVPARNRHPNALGLE